MARRRRSLRRVLRKFRFSPTLKVAALVGLTLQALGFVLLRIDTQPQPSPPRPAPFVSLAPDGSASRRDAWSAQAELRDSTPLLLPTRWNAASAAFTTGADEPFAVFSPFPPDVSLEGVDGESLPPLNVVRPEAVAVLETRPPRPFAPRGPATDQPPPGRELRWEVAALTDGAVVRTGVVPLPPEAPAAAREPGRWRVYIGPAGPVGRPFAVGAAPRPWREGVLGAPFALAGLPTGYYEVRVIARAEAVGDPVAGR